MNHNRLDRLSQTLADTSLQSRRGVLAALGIAVLGALAGVDTDAASAKRKTRHESKPKTGHQGKSNDAVGDVRLHAAKRKKHGRNRGQRHGQERPGGGATTPPPDGTGGGGCTSQPNSLTCAGLCGMTKDNCGLEVDCGPCGGGGCTSDDQAVTCAGKCSTVKDNCGRDVNCGNTCSGFDTCGGGGASNTCGCTSQPQSVTCGGRCGMETDNCGRQVDCGTCTGGGCFIAGTQVTMANGSDKPIELVEPGDRVLGRGGKINRVRSILYPMLGDRQLYALNGGTAFVTASHPFLTTDGWKAVDPDAAREEVPGLDIERLTVGDVLLSVTSRGGRMQGREDVQRARDPTAEPGGSPRRRSNPAVQPRRRWRRHLRGKRPGRPQ